MFQSLAEWLFPAKCIGCGVRGTPLCTACRRELPHLPEGTCARCSAWRSARGACRSCRRLSPVLRSVHAAFAYEGAAREAVVTLKFRGGRYLAPLMGELWRAELVGQPIYADLLVPVPLTVERQRERGFNQAALLADELALTLGRPVLKDVLVRRERPAQRTLGAAQRLRNLRGAIACVQPDAVAGQRVLLVDDVVTTGATLSACAASLAAAGAQRISALAFARDL